MARRIFLQTACLAANASLLIASLGCSSSSMDSGGQKLTGLPPEPIELSVEQSHQTLLNGPSPNERPFDGK